MYPAIPKISISQYVPAPKLWSGISITKEGEKKKENRKKRREEGRKEEKKRGGRNEILSYIEPEVTYSHGYAYLGAEAKEKIKEFIEKKKATVHEE